MSKNEYHSWQIFGGALKEIREVHERRSPALSDADSAPLDLRQAIAKDVLKPLTAQEITEEDITAWETRNAMPAPEQYRALENALIYFNPHISNPVAESDYLKRAYDQSDDFGGKLKKYRGNLTRPELVRLVNNSHDQELAPGEKKRLVLEGSAFIGKIEEGKVRPSEALAQLLSEGLTRSLRVLADSMAPDEQQKLKTALQQLESDYDARLDQPDPALASLRKRLGYSLQETQRDTSINWQAKYHTFTAKAKAEAEEGKLWNELHREYQEKQQQRREAAEDDWIGKEMQRRGGGSKARSIAEIKQQMQVLFTTDPTYGLNINDIAHETHHHWATIKDVFNPALTKVHFHPWARLAAHVQTHNRSLDDYIRLTRECNKALKDPANSRSLYDIKTELTAVCKGNGETYKNMSKEMGLNDTYLAKILSPRSKENNFELWAALADYLSTHSTTPEQSIREFAELTIELDRALQKEKAAKRAKRAVIT